MKDSGRIVETKSGKRGRTYNKKPLILGKVPVYLEIAPNVYSDKGVLCDPKTLKIIGFID